jgi:2-hydroxychromene-2-carboxylate isomerase
VHHVRFYLDVVSPYAYLAFERLPELLQGLSVVVDYRPVLFAGLLQHWGQKGPAEIEPKRQWTFRQVHWQAARHGIPLDTPVQHPFNPLPLQRLLLAAGPNRRTLEAVLHHVWRGGAAADDPQRLAALTARLAPALAHDSPAVKQQLRTHTEQAAARGVFGVPTFALGERLFWGHDGLEMLVDALHGEAWFQGPAWDREGAPRLGVRRG